MNESKPTEGDVAEVPNSSDAEVNDDDDEGFVVLKSPQAQQAVIEVLQTEVNQKNDKIVLLEKEVQSLLQINGVLKQEVLKFEDEIKSKEQRAQELQESLDNKCLNVVRYCKEVEDLEAAFKTEQTKNHEMQKTLEHKLQSAFADKEDVVHELNVAKNHLESLELSKINLELEVDGLKSQLEKSADSENKLKQEVEELKSQLEKSSDSGNKLKQEAEVLKLRLKKAAEVYEDKYKYSVKLEGKMQRLQQKINFLKSPASSYSGPAFDPPPQTVFPETAANETQVADVPSVLESSTEVPTDAATGITADDVPSVLESAGEEEASEDRDSDIGCLPCSICNEQIVCTIRDMRPMTDHLEKEHKQLVCPVCSQMFDKNIPGIDSYFHLHVENHFDVCYPK